LQQPKGQESWKIAKQEIDDASKRRRIFEEQKRSKSN
jgi:hypothetical protein